jgi:hypothetical protein
MYKYEVFKRLNRGGSTLEEQELRNCAVRLLDDVFPDFIRSVAKDQAFLQALTLSEDDVREAYTDELALRFFTMKNYAAKFRHEVRDLLTEYMEQVAKGALAFDRDQERLVFQRTWTALNRAFPEGTSFRARKKGGQVTGSFSPTLFELLSLAIAWNLDRAEKMPEQELRSRLDDLATSAQADGLLGAGSNSRRKTLGRVDKARSWLTAS